MYVMLWCSVLIAALLCVQVIAYFNQKQVVDEKKLKKSKDRQKGIVYDHVYTFT